MTLNIKFGSKKKSTYPHAAQENGFSPAFLLSLLRLVKAQQSCAPATREECNKYDPIVDPCFCLFLIGQS